MNPWDELADALEAVTALEDVNVYATPTPDYVPDAIVIRPGSPWIEPGPQFPADTDRYVAVAVVSASTPGDGTARLHMLVHAIADTARLIGWEFESASEPVIDESITPALASAVSLIYRNCAPETEESS